MICCTVVVTMLQTLYHSSERKYRKQTHLSRAIDLPLEFKIIFQETQIANKPISSYTVFVLGDA